MTRTESMAHADKESAREWKWDDKLIYEFIVSNKWTEKNNGQFSANDRKMMRNVDTTERETATSFAKQQFLVHVVPSFALPISVVNELALICVTSAENGNGTVVMPFLFVKTEEKK